MSKKILYWILIMIFIPIVQAVPDVYYDDNWTITPGIGDHDGMVWGGFYMDIATSPIPNSADALCYDWDGNGKFGACFFQTGLASTVCDSAFDIVRDAGDSVNPSVIFGGNCNIRGENCDQVMDTYSSGANLSHFADAIYFANCSASGVQKEVNDERYYIVNAKKYLCSYDFQAETDYEYNVRWFQQNNSWANSTAGPLTCGTFERCDRNSGHVDFDNDPVYTSLGSISDPCTLLNGSNGNYSCSSNSQCFSGNCGGAKTEKRNLCLTDASSNYIYQDKLWDSTCGLTGYVVSDWGFETNTSTTCSATNGTGYICDIDEDLDVVLSGTPPSPCRANLNQTCARNSTCWNNNGGNWCSSINKCTNGNNGYLCGLDIDCDTGRCDSTCMSKLADGEMCNENSDCTNSNCISGICGGLKCDGTAEVLAQDVNGNSLKGLSLYVNGSFNKTTNDVGQVIVNFDNVLCGRNFNFTMKCSNNVTVCSTQTVSIDVNNDVDNLPPFDCSICTPARDLVIDQSDIYVNVSNNQVKIEVNSFGINRSVRVNLRRQTKDFFVVDNLNQTIVVSSFSKKNATFNLSSIDRTDFLHIYVDNNNSVREDDETNNYVFRVAVKPVKAFVNVDTGYSVLNPVIKEYLSSFVDVVNSKSSADVVVNVGRPIALRKNFLLKSVIVDGNGRKAIRPYAGVVEKGYFIIENTTLNKPEILAYGNGIEGDLAAVKRLVNARSLFLNPTGIKESQKSYIDDSDPLGIKIKDLLNDNETKTLLKGNSQALADKVKKVLYNNNFEVSIRPVKTTNGTSYHQQTILRVKHVNSDYSEGYKDAINVSDTPVVFSGGLFSNLFSWEERNGLAKKISSEGHDVWEIEMTGGPYQDCINCQNYTYNDLVDYYWPALIGGVINYTNKTKIDYVGHSNGCRVALSSLNSYSLEGKVNSGYYFDYNSELYKHSSINANPVRKFIGVGCPANLDDYSLAGSTARDKIDSSGELKGNYAIRILKEQQKSHILRQDYGKLANILSWPFTLGGDHISLNLMEYYNDLYVNSSTNINVSRINVTSINLIGGTSLNSILQYVPRNDSDGAVPTSDITYIYNNIPVSNKTIIFLHLDHGELKTEKPSTSEIRRRIND